MTRFTSLFLAVSATVALSACGSSSPAGPTPVPTPLFQTGEIIALQSDTGKFLSRVSRSGLDPVEAAKDVIDAFSRFRVTVLEDGKVALAADNGQWLGRIRRSGNDPVEAAAAGIDAFSRFTVTRLDEQTVALQADNGLYLSRIKRGDLDPIEAAKATIDTFSRFRITRLQ